MSSKTDSYADIKQQLEETIAALQASDISIEEALELHATGTKLLSRLEKQLEDHELQVKKVTSA